MVGMTSAADLMYQIAAYPSIGAAAELDSAFELVTCAEESSWDRHLDESDRPPRLREPASRPGH